MTFWYAITNLTYNSFPYMFISILYMFRTATCPSSGKLIVSTHLVYVTVYMTFWYAITNLTHNSFTCIFISILYMFRSATCPSSGELILSIRHLVYATLCRYPSGMQEHMLLHTRRASTQSGIYQMSY